MRKHRNRPIVFVDTPTSVVQLSEIQQMLSMRKRLVQDRILTEGPLSGIPIMYPPARSYKVFLLRLINYLKAQDISTRYFNTSVHTMDEIAAVEEDPLCFVFSDTTPQLEEILKMASELKAAFPKSLIVIGGSHSTAAPAEVLREGVDIVICGEGDISFLLLIQALLKGVPLSNLSIAGVYTSVEQPGQKPSLAPQLENLAHLPLPSYDSLPGGLKAFHAYLISTRGCPYSCPYCVQGAMQNDCRVLSPRQTWKEIDEIWQRVKDAYNFIHIADDNITGYRDSRLSELLRYRLPSVNAYFCGEIRLDACTAENIANLKALRFVQLNIGIESLDERVQERIGKRYAFQRIVNTLSMIKDIYDGEIMIKAYLMVGLPGEDVETLKSTSDKVSELIDRGLLDLVSVRMFKPLPGTRIYEHASEYDLAIKYGSLSDFERYSYPPVHRLKALSKTEIYLLYLALEARILDLQERKHGIEYKDDWQMGTMNYSRFMGKLV